MNFKFPHKRWQHSFLAMHFLVSGEQEEGEKVKVISDFIQGVQIKAGGCWESDLMQGDHADECVNFFNDKVSWHWDRVLRRVQRLNTF